jgi:hypothetical protein
VDETSFLVLKSSKSTEDRFDCQSKYVNDLLKNFSMKNAISIKAHIVTNGRLHLDEKVFLVQDIFTTVIIDSMVLV